MTQDQTATLEALLNDISALEWQQNGQKLRTLVPYELLPAIKSKRATTQEYNRRVAYYADTKGSKKYKTLHTALQNSFWELHSLINPKKLSSRHHFLLPKALPITPKEWDEGKDGSYTDIHGFYDLLVEEKRWNTLGDRKGQIEKLGTEDSLFTPWRATMEQYERVAFFLNRVEQCDAVRKTGTEEIERFLSLLGELESLIKEPWYQLHIGSFEYVHRYATQYSSQEGEEGHRLTKPDDDARKTFELIKEAAMIVCEDLIASVDNSTKSGEGKAKRVGRPPKPVFTSDHKWEGVNICKIRRNSKMARLCEITFARSEEKGQTWTWDEIYERVNGQPRSSDEEWRHVDKWVRHLNQKASKNGHDDLLLFSGGSDGVVQRLV